MFFENVDVMSAFISPGGETKALDFMIASY